MDFELRQPSMFPDGTRVGAYPEANWPAIDRLRPSGAPLGDPADEQTVVDDVATFDLDPGHYWLVAEVGGTFRYLRTQLMAEEGAAPTFSFDLMTTSLAGSGGGDHGNPGERVRGFVVEEEPRNVMFTVPDSYQGGDLALDLLWGDRDTDAQLGAGLTALWEISLAAIRAGTADPYPPVYVDPAPAEEEAIPADNALTATTFAFSGDSLPDFAPGDILSVCFDRARPVRDHYEGALFIVSAILAEV